MTVTPILDVYHSNGNYEMLRRLLKNLKTKQMRVHKKIICFKVEVVLKFKSF